MLYILLLTYEANVEVHENEPTSHLIYSLSELVPNDCLVLISSFKSSSTQHDVHLVNDGPTKSQCFLQWWLG